MSTSKSESIFECHAADSLDTEFPGSAGIRCLELSGIPRQSECNPF